MILTVSAQSYYSHLEWLLRLVSFCRRNGYMGAAVLFEVRGTLHASRHAFFAGNRSPKFDSEIGKWFY